MSNQSFPVYGVVKEIDGSTLAGTNINVFLYNKTKDEIKSGNDAGNEDLITDASSEFQGNLGNFPTQWQESDDIWLSCRKGSKTAMTRFTLSGTGGKQIDLTLEELEPIMNIKNFLRMRMRDFNTTRNNSTAMVKTTWSEKNTSLTKNSYPRVILNKEDGEGSPAGITSQVSKKSIILNIKSIVWGKISDFQEFTIGDTNYEGPALLDQVSKEVSTKLEQGFYKHPTHTQDPHIQQYWNYLLTKDTNEDFEEEKGYFINNMEIELKYIRQN